MISKGGLWSQRKKWASHHRANLALWVELRGARFMRLGDSARKRAQILFIG